MLDYTSVLKLLFLMLAAAMVWRFLRTGGRAMLKMMSAQSDHPEQDLLPAA